MDHANGQGLNDASGQMMFRPHRAMHGISPMAPVSGERWSVAGRSPVGAIAGLWQSRPAAQPPAGLASRISARQPPT